MSQPACFTAAHNLLIPKQRKREPAIGFQFNPEKKQAPYSANLDDGDVAGCERVATFKIIVRH
jgi:hypothetical protein